MEYKVIIIAEAGVNHNGSLETAYRLADAAKEAGADYVKYQLSIPAQLISKHAQQADYQKRNTGKTESQLDMIKKLALTFDEHAQLKSYCDSIGVHYLCTPFIIPAIDFLDSLGMPFWKLPSGAITDYPYLVHIAQTGKPVVLSTGMASMDEIHAAYDVLVSNGLTKDQITLLHCTTEYPAPKNEVNLKCIQTLHNEFGISVGYSDHTQGIEIPIAAVALGAKVIEKHFTLSREMVGPDHKASLEPHELKQMVEQIRNIESALGDGEKRVTDIEKKNKLVARKSIVAKIAIKKGEVFSEANITAKRPGSGLSPMRWNDVIGTCAIRDFEEDELIEI